MDNKEVNQIDKTIAEIKEKNTRLESNKIKDQEEILLNKMLDEEIKKINNKIKNSKPKWILENFDEFVCKKFDNNKDKVIIEVKILKRKDAFKLGALLKKLRGKNLDNTSKIKIVWSDNSNYWSYKNYLDEDKVIELLKGWVFYYNTKIRYEKIKFNQSGYNKIIYFMVNIAVKLLYIVLILVVLLGMIKVFIIVQGLMSLI
ncbi:hypothetical protein [Clostridium massiliamazoniense]|uniref:hypothetical protein n=1 Tax=Clostridium massiliamazoniense TaxID=1347366 RepID=UPI0006D85FA7|nr:hypothetical protein [Clostridium massiliamazoniense]